MPREGWLSSGYFAQETPLLLRLQYMWCPQDTGGSRDSWSPSIDIYIYEFFSVWFLCLLVDCFFPSCILNNEWINFISFILFIRLFSALSGRYGTDIAITTNTYSVIVRYRGLIKSSYVWLASGWYKKENFSIDADIASACSCCYRNATEIKVWWYCKVQLVRPGIVIIMSWEGKHAWNPESSSDVKFAGLHQLWGDRII